MAEKVENHICLDCKNFRCREDYHSVGMMWYNHMCESEAAYEMEKVMTPSWERHCDAVRGRSLDNLTSTYQDMSNCDGYDPLEQKKWRKVFIFWPRKIDEQWHFLETVEGRQVNDLVFRQLLWHEKCVLKPRWEYRKVTIMDDENVVSLG